MAYIKHCAECGEKNLTINVITIKRAQFYEIVCPKCGETSVNSTVLEDCIDDWNSQSVE